MINRLQIKEKSEQLNIPFKNLLSAAVAEIIIELLANGKYCNELYLCNTGDFSPEIYKDLCISNIYYEYVRELDDKMAILYMRDILKEIMSKAALEGFIVTGNVDENGISYKGPWVNGKKHGKGEEFYQNDMLKYDGEFVDDKYEGDGIFYYENKDYYIGKFLDGKKSGRGIEYYENGDPKYEGEFAFDKYEGNGKYNDTNGDTYKGKFFDGKFSGVIFDKDGNIKNNKKSIFPELIEGECKIF